jgi:outer membrane lipoprotein-sorting protein
MTPVHELAAFRPLARSAVLSAVAVALVAPGISAWAQEARLKTADAVLERYKQALGGSEAVNKVQSMTVRGEIESSARPGKSTFVYYARPFKSQFKLTRPDGSEITAGFDGKTSWTVTPQGARIDRDTAVDANRRDTDLQYALHQPDYFRKLELAGVVDFEGHRCYWLHGTTNWGKDNNQFYDVGTGLLVGYRFESDDASKTITIALFGDYKNFGGPLIATRNVSRSAERSQTTTYKSVSYDPLPDSLFELPEAVKRLMKQ